MRGNKKNQLVREQRKEFEDKRSEASKKERLRGRQRAKVEELAKAIQGSPAGRNGGDPESERGVGAKEGAGNYQKTRSRASTRMGGRRKQVLAEKLEVWRS